MAIIKRTGKSSKLVKIPSPKKKSKEYSSPDFDYSAIEELNTVFRENTKNHGELTTILSKILEINRESSNKLERVVDKMSDLGDNITAVKNALSNGIVAKVEGAVRDTGDKIKDEVQTDLDLRLKNLSSSIKFYVWSTFVLTLTLIGTVITGIYWLMNHFPKP